MTLPALRGIHHVKLAVSDLPAALDFYERALGARRILQADHRDAAGELYAHILEIPGLGTLLELRLNPEQAARHRRFDSLTIAVDDRQALSQWSSHLETQQIRHSPVLVAIQAWLIVLEDPDQNRLRLYTLETHGPDLRPAADSPWLTD